MFILIISSTIFVGCGNNDDNNNTQNAEPTKLSAPVLSWNNGTISWDAVDNAAKYEISLNNEISYTYDTSLNINVTNNLSHYDIKVKSISESLDYTNSDFCEELKFDTIKLDKPNLSYTIKHSEHLISLTWNMTNLYADYYELYLNGNFHSTISLDEIETQVNEDEWYVQNNITCSYDLKGEIFNIGRNDFYIKALSNNIYYLNSDESNDLWLNKNSPYTNIRVENGELLYNDSSIYNIDYDAVNIDYNFPVINKEIPEKQSVVNPKDYTLWSDPVYVNIYRIHSPKIIDYQSNLNSINITIQGYDPTYAGTEHKNKLGYDYDKIDFIFYINDSVQFTITKNSNCLDEEIFTFEKNEIENKNCSINDIKKISIKAHKDGFVSSKIFTYTI